MVLLIFAIWSHFLVQKSKANIQFLIDVGLLLLEVTSGAIDSSQLTLQGSAKLHSLHGRCKTAQARTRDCLFRFCCLVQEIIAIWFLDFG